MTGREYDKEDRMKGMVAIVAPDRGKLDNLLGAAPDDVEVKWIDSRKPTHVQAEQMSDVLRCWRCIRKLPCERL